jgi:hypothetical protein
MSLVDGGGPILSHVQVQMIFWGNQWKMDPSPIPDLMGRTKRIVSSVYMAGLAEYRGIGQGTILDLPVIAAPQTNPEPSWDYIGTMGTVDQPITVLYGPWGNFPDPLAGTPPARPGFDPQWPTLLAPATSEPPALLTLDDDVIPMIKDLIRVGAVPGPNTNNQLLYCVFTPNNVRYGQYDFGDHSYFSEADQIAHYAWIGWRVDNPWNLTSIDLATMTFSHELVEACTNPELNAFSFNDHPPSIYEIGDRCVNNGPQYVDLHVCVQPYWIPSLNRCDVSPYQG